LAADVWVDDSLSMFTREQGQTRIQAALQDLLSYLDEQRFSRIRLHSLGDPAASLALEGEDRSAWAARMSGWADRPRAEPSPPSAITLSQQRRHILLTDGADEALNRWVQSAPLTYVIRTGTLGDNLVLSRLALRAPLNDSGIVEGTVRVENLGDTAKRLRLVIERQATMVRAVDVELAPHGNHVAAFSLAAGETEGLLEARLQADGDPLPLDDSLQIDIAQLHPAIAYRLTGNCEPGFLAVLESHPALARTGGSAGLSIYCEGGPTDPAPPALVLHPATTPLRSTQRAHWHRELAMGYLPVGAGAAYNERAPLLASPGTPILSADEHMLIAGDSATAEVVHVYLDFGDAAFAHEAQYPLLILGLLSEITGYELDTAPATSSRDPSASRIRPLPLPVGDATPPPPDANAISFRKPIIALLLLLLLADAVPAFRSAAGKPS
jgi:hypothetical protein